jgi:hypothetical protein
VSKQRFLLAMTLFFFLMGGCVPAPVPVVENPQDMIATIAAATVAALPTTTPQPTWTASPSPTRARNTPTDIPTNTPAPTIEMIASPTSIFQLPGPGTPLAGMTTIPLSLWSPTPEPFQCDLNKTEPEPYTKFKPRYFFKAEWRVWNRGSVIWKADGVIFYFIGGDKLHNDEERAEGITLPYAVYPQDKVLLYVGMTSPREPGTYSSTWGLRRENRDAPFCTFNIVIRVE